ncbi:unnamed protein product [Xylocopa violacea]
MQAAVAGPNSSTEDVHNSQTCASGQEEFTCSLYISRAVGSQGQVQGTQGDELLHSNLEEIIRASDPLAAWQVSKTPCGLIAAFAREADAEKLLQRGDLARTFEGPVQVARFSAKDSRYRQAILLRDVPWAIPLQDINSALAKQGITTGSVERCRQYIRVEVLNAEHYELLLRQGLDFFGAARFNAIPERWWRGGTGSAGGPLQTGPGMVNNFLEASNLQTGDGYRQCPVRQQLSNATPISITLSTIRIGNQYPVNAASKTNATSHESQPLKSGHT